MYESAEEKAKTHVSPAGVRWSVASQSTNGSRQLARGVGEAFRSRIETEEILATRRENIEKAKNAVKDYLLREGVSEYWLKELDAVSLRSPTSIFSRIAAAWAPHTDEMILKSDFLDIETGAHELSHAAARNSVHEGNALDSQSNNIKRVVTKSGFNTLVGETNPTSYFLLLNEAMTHEVARRALGSAVKFRRERRFLEHLLNSLVIQSVGAGSNTESKSADVWKMFLDSYLFGWTPALKKSILDTFGSKALKILGLLKPVHIDADADDGGDAYLDTLADDITAYFKYPKKRDEVFEESILNRLQAFPKRVGAS